MRDFKPNLIIEATSVCDKSCNGCYATNLLSKKNPKQLHHERPELFLSMDKLADALSKIGDEIGPNMGMISIRGGEPTLHPELSKLLDLISKHAEELFIETHGKWLLNEGNDFEQNYGELIRACSEKGAILKLSFDEMHGTTSDQLKTMIEVARGFGVETCVAVTEFDLESFNKSIAKISFIKKEDIIYQLKAKFSEELINSERYVVTSLGKVNQILSNKLRSKFEV